MKNNIKICVHCKQKKSINEFCKSKKSQDGLNIRCNDCYRDDYLKRTHNITFKQYKEISNSQNNCCAICKIHESKLKQGLHVDHNHKTGVIRGLLCVRCNFAIEQYTMYPKEFKHYLKTVSQRMIKFYKKWLNKLGETK